MWTSRLALARLSVLSLGQSVGRSVGRSVGQSIGRPVGRSVGRSVGQSEGVRSVTHCNPLSDLPGRTGSTGTSRQHMQLQNGVTDGRPPFEAAFQPARLFSSCAHYVAIPVQASLVDRWYAAGIHIPTGAGHRHGRTGQSNNQPVKVGGQTNPQHPLPRPASQFAVRALCDCYSAVDPHVEHVKSQPVTRDSDCDPTSPFLVL